MEEAQTHLCKAMEDNHTKVFLRIFKEIKDLFAPPGSLNDIKRPSTKPIDSGNDVKVLKNVL